VEVWVEVAWRLSWMTGVEGVGEEGTSVEEAVAV
jgi:hypothetical protein